MHGPGTRSTRFVGRQHELQELRGVIRERRVICLWGPPGMGKTRLAEEIVYGAAGALDAPRSVAWVELADVADAARVEALLVDALSTSKKPSLVILDGADDCLDVLARELPRVRTQAPSTTWIITTCERGRLDGEWAYAVGPLETTKTGDPAHGGAAGELLIDRACLALGRTTLSEEAIPDLCAIASRLDGVPLFIELAASCLPILGLDGIRQALGIGGGQQQGDAILDVLRVAKPPRGARSALERVEKCIAALPMSLRHALRMLSFFRGQFSVGDAAHVFGVSGVEAFEQVQALRDRSLLSGPASVARDAYLENWSLIRALSLRDTPSDLRESATARVTECVLRRAERAVADVEASRSRAALNELSIRKADLRAVLDQACEAGWSRATMNTAGRAIVALGALWMADPSALSHDDLDKVIDGAAVCTMEPDLLARVVASRARIRALSEGAHAALPDLEQALELVKTTENHRLEAALLVERGVLHHRERDLSAAGACYTAALERSGSDDPYTQARALGNLAAVAHDRGDLEEAAPAYERAIAIAAAIGEARLEGIFAANLALVDQEQGAMHAAAKRYESALTLLEGVGDRRLLAITIGNLGVLHHEEGHLEPARRCHERAITEMTMIGDVTSLVLARARLASVLASQDCIEEARVEIERAARVQLKLSGGPEGSAYLTLAEGFVDVAMARRAMLEKRDVEIDARIAAAQKRMADVQALRGPDGTELTGNHDDLRSLTRILARSLEASSSALTLAQEQVLLVTQEARWFRPPGGSWRDLRQRHVARRILDRLITARRDPDCNGLSLEKLRDAGWPGERILSDAAKNRIYVALNQLRRLGLRPWLMHSVHGWSLDPALVVHRVALEPMMET